MTGLTEGGFRERIRQNRLELTTDEAVDLFFMYPTLVDIEWDEDKNAISVFLSGLNLKFSITY